MKKICLISGISALGLGLIIFCIGAALGRSNPAHTPVMWVGVSFFLLGILIFLFYIFYKAFLVGREKSKEKQKDKISIR